MTAKPNPYDNISDDKKNINMEILYMNTFPLS